MEKRNIFFLCAFSSIFVIIICIFLTPAVFDPMVTYFIVTIYCLIILFIQIIAYNKERVMVDHNMDHNMLNQIVATDLFDRIDRFDLFEQVEPEISLIDLNIKNRRLYIYWGWEISFIYRMKRYLRKIEGIKSVFVSYREKDFDNVDHLKLVNVKFIFKNQDFSLRCYLHHWDHLAFILDSRSILVTYEFSDILKISFLLYHSLQLNTIILPNQFQILM